MNAEDMYQEVIIDYYRNPKNKGHLPHPDMHARDTNPLCGDQIQIEGTVQDDYIKELVFDGKGCVISMAAASMLTEASKGMALEGVKAMSKEEVLKLLNIPISPLRIKCALLPLKVLKLAVYKYLGEKYDEKD